MNSFNQELTREELRKVPIAARDDVGDRWQGIRHGELADILVEEAEAAGLKVLSETWVVNPTKTALYGKVEVEPTEGFAPGVNPCLGIRHDNKSRYALSMSLDGKVLVCNNPLFSGEFELRHRHQKGLDLRTAVKEGVELWKQRADEISTFVEMLRSVPLSEEDAAYLLLVAARPGSKHECITWEKTKPITLAWNTPEYAEFQPRTLWSWYNSCALISQELSGFRRARMLYGLREIVTTYAQQGLAGLAS